MPIGAYTILRGKDGEILAGAKLSQLGARYGRIALVYTKPEARGNGYAGMAVAAIAQEIIAAGRMPMLYTDGDYPSSNRAYAKVGFIPVGELLKCQRSG